MLGSPHPLAPTTAQAYATDTEVVTTSISSIFRYYIASLTDSYKDLRERLGNIVVGWKKDKTPVLLSEGEYLVKITHETLHQKIYAAIENLISKGMLANPITLKNYFENDSNLADLDGHEYLVKVTKFSTSLRQS